MAKHLLKWFLFSLIMPLLVFLIGEHIHDKVILLFWPSSIYLMSLGAEKNELIQVVYTWSIAVGINVILYQVIGLVVYYLKKVKR